MSAILSSDPQRIHPPVELLAGEVLTFASLASVRTGGHSGATLVGLLPDRQTFLLTVRRFAEDHVRRRDYVAYILRAERAIAYAHGRYVTAHADDGTTADKYVVGSETDSRGVLRIYQVDAQQAGAAAFRLESEHERAADPFFEPYLGLIADRQSEDVPIDAELAATWSADRADPSCCIWIAADGASPSTHGLAETFDAVLTEKRSLMQEAGALRGRLFPAASDEAWRRERLYRFLYWREHGEHAPSNLIGAWDVGQIREEIARWQDYARRKLSEQDALDELCAALQKMYGKSWDDALEEGTSALLARVNQSVWHEQTGTLLPQQIGHLVIFGAERYDDPKLGWSYQYGNRETGQKVSIFLYTAGDESIADGLADPRLEGQVRSACNDIGAMLKANGATPVEDSLVGPVQETLSDGHGRQVQFVGCYVDAIDSDGTRRAESASIRGFRGHWLKIRYTKLPHESDDGHPGLEEINSDLAEYVAHFG